MFNQSFYKAFNLCIYLSFIPMIISFIFCLINIIKILKSKN